MGGAAADFDLDGKMDIFIANDKAFNWLFRNDGRSLDEVGFDANVALREDGIFISGMGVDFRDLDNDGYPDIVVVALDNETFPIYRNTGKGSFTEVTRDSGMTRASLPMAGYSPNIADFDNDGWKDIFVTRGHVQSPLSANRQVIEQPNTVFHNLGGMKFAALTAEAGLTSRPRVAAPRIGCWRPEWRWTHRRCRNRAQRTGGSLDEPEPEPRPLAGVETSRNEE